MTTKQVQPSAASSKTDETIVGEFVRNARGEVIRTTLQTRKGKPKVSVRTWYPSAETGEFLPGHGFTIDPEKLPALLDAIAAAMCEAEARGWIKATSDAAA